MRKYNANDERAIGTERLVREWTRSGLLTKSQEEQMLPELKVDLRRTNLFFRLIMFGFGILIIGALMLLTAVTLDLKGEVAIAFTCFIGAAASIAIAEFMTSRFRLYRFGIEEAAAIAAGILVAGGATVLILSSHATRQDELAVFVGLLTAAIAGLAIYLRFGYLHAAIAAIICAGLAPFASDWSEISKRLASAGCLFLIFLVARAKSRNSSDEFPRNEYSILQATAWSAVYACLNLQLSSFRPFFSSQMITGPTYWFTYAAIWLIPTAGLFLAIRERERPLLDVNILLILVTLATNKAYLGAAEQTWDPILLGVLLIGTVVALRRWLAGGDRHGFTATRILLSDKRGIAAVATATAAFHGMPQASSQAPEPGLDPGGGRSGGAGASGSF